jgi:hypothetical protein
MDEQTRLNIEQRLEDVLRRDLGAIPVRPFAIYNQSPRAGTVHPIRRLFSIAGAAAVIAVVILVALAAAFALRELKPTPATVPVPSTTPSASPSGAASSPSASPALPPGTFENRILGYRITLPLAYRLIGSSINAGQPENLGSEAFTVSSVADARAECLSETGSGLAGLVKGELVNVAVMANVRGLAVVPWAAGSPWGSLHTAEAVTVGGYPAARLIQQGIADAYVISANDRMYVLSHLNSPSSQRLADIATSFRAVPPLPFPTAPPPQIGRDAANTLGQRLAQAFAAKDATAVAGLMTDCRIGAGENVGGRPLGTEGISRPSAAFITALRDRFAKGDLTVTVNPEVQVQAVSGQFFVRSEWKEPDRTIPIDLFLRELDGRWQWTSAIHYYPSLVGSGCIPYRNPWVTSSCEAGR